MDKKLDSDFRCAKQFGRNVMEKSKDVENIIYNTMVKCKQSQDNNKILADEIKAIKRENRAIRKILAEDDQLLDDFLKENMNKDLSSEKINFA